MAEDLAQALFDHIPVGVGSQGIIPTTMDDLEAALEMGMDYSIREASSSIPQLFLCCHQSYLCSQESSPESLLQVGKIIINVAGSIEASACTWR